MRLFVALDLPHSLRERLSWMAGGLPGARWVAPENYHVTLRFIGELPGYRAEEVDLALASLRAPGFTVQLKGVGTFEKGGRVNSLWVGVERNPQLDHLQTKIETALQRAGFDRERRRFTPHVTLARITCSGATRCRSNASPCSAPGWARSRRSIRPRSNTSWRECCLGHTPYISKYIEHDA